MTRRAIEDQKYELIKGHALNPEESPLPVEHREQLDRIITATKILDKNPVQKNAVSLLRLKYPNVSKSQAYADIRLAMRLFNTFYSFDYDFWQTWLINDIVRNIEQCRNAQTAGDRRIIAMEHANLVKAIGEKPEELPDPRRNEKHSFYIMVNVNNNQTIKIDENSLHKLPVDTLHELNKALFGGREIEDADVEEIWKS